MFIEVHSLVPILNHGFKCITKEADLMCQLLMCGHTTSALIFCGKIREHALSFMTYKGPEHVAAAATMMVHICLY